MCNIAGYIGPHDCAPILCEMMKKQSGFLGGYYSGIATVSDGKLHMTKLMGDMDLLITGNHGDKLPGKTGILHSRSKSAGDGKWAHPFVSYDGKTAYIANGSKGVFKDEDRSADIAAMLCAQGVVFDSASDKMGNKYTPVPDGRRVHVSEVMAHYIRYIQLNEHLSLDCAMEQAFMRLPSEIVGLCVDADAPGTIYFARYNMPMMVARTEDEVFIASTAIAFPSDRRYISMDLVPACSSGTITLEQTKIHRFRSSVPVLAPTPSYWNAVKSALESKLTTQETPVSFHDFSNATKSIWPVGKMAQKHYMVYEVLREMMNMGRVELLGVDAPGADEGLEQGIRTTKIYVKMTDKF